jgi:hypothetical protein
MHNLTKNILLLLLIFILFFPFLQRTLDFFTIKPLQGAITNPVDTSFTFKYWFDGSFQVKKENYINSSFGFRNIFVRLNNQISFCLFNKAKANQVLIGKDNVLFEKSHVDAYFGSDFLGNDSINKLVGIIKMISDTMKKQNKNLIIAFAPNKGEFYPEYFADDWKIERKMTNYECFKQQFAQKGIDCIDLNSYFLSLKGKTPYPIYPPYGIHWTSFSISYVIDTLLDYLSNLRHQKFCQMRINQMGISYIPRNDDDDIERGMNLLFRFDSPEMLYPQIGFNEVPGAVRPKIIVIADSYFWGIYHTAILFKVFDNGQFWYYNKQVFPDHGSPLYTDNLDVNSEIKQADMILVMATPATLSRLGWGFFQTAQNIYFNQMPAGVMDHDQSKIKEIEDYIRKDTDWYNKEVKKALIMGISVDSLIHKDAIYLNDQKKSH